MSETYANYGEGAAWPRGATAVETNRYALAGWLCIVQAAIFPAAMVLSWIQGIVGAKAFDFEGPVFGPADLLFLIFTVLSVYTLLKFKGLLNERYQFHGADLILPIVIIFGVVIMLATTAAKSLVLLNWPVSKAQLVMGSLALMGFMSVVGGVMDIILAAVLLKARESLGQKIAIFGYITLATGIMELTVILFPIVSFLLMPASYITLAVIFLQKEEGAEFV